MLLTITTTTAPATDLGYLLHKHPDRFQTHDISYGRVHVFYPEATDTRCTAALVVDLDPVRLVRTAGRNAAPLSQYVNDRPWVASSFLSVAISQVLGSALSGSSRERPKLAADKLALELVIPVVPCRGPQSLLHDLFEPLGYSVMTTRLALDPEFPEWGDSRYYRLELHGTQRLSDTLSHLYVLLPALDAQKHYWVGNDEIDKLLRHGEGWLGGHPLREQIVQRYLPRSRSLARTALQRLAELDDEVGDEDAEPVEPAPPEAVVSLGKRRMQAVAERLKDTGSRSVVDLGCGEGKLLRKLLEDDQFAHIVGLDVSHRALEIAERRLKLDRMPPAQRERLKLIHGSLVYRDSRLEGFDAAAVVEVIEHLDPHRLQTFATVLLGCARPQWVVLTTPNGEYNAVWESLPAGAMRHSDHRFEWSRAEFGDWVAAVCEEHGYTVHERFGVGDEVSEYGFPTQGVVLRRDSA